MWDSLIIVVWILMDLAALLLPGRKDDQCAKRYTEILAPSVNRRLQKWTPEEDAYLRTKVQELGHSWSIISVGLPGRPPLTCRNRWRALSKNKTQSPESGSVPNVLPQFLIPDNENDADAVPTVPYQHLRSASQTHGAGSTPQLDIQALETFLDGSEFNLDIAEFDTMQPSDAGYQSALPEISLSARQNNDIPIPFPGVGSVDEHRISDAWGLHSGTEHLISQTSMNHNQAFVLLVASPADPENAQFACTATNPADSLASAMPDADCNDPATSTSSPKGFSPRSSGSDVDSRANGSLPREPAVGAGRDLHSQNSSTVHVHHHVHHHHYHYHYYP